jgi:hypothetical protein
VTNLPPERPFTIDAYNFGWRPTLNKQSGEARNLVVSARSVLTLFQTYQK